MGFPPSPLTSPLPAFSAHPLPSATPPRRLRAGLPLLVCAHAGVRPCLRENGAADVNELRSAQMAARRSGRRRRPAAQPLLPKPLVPFCLVLFLSFHRREEPPPGPTPPRSGFDLEGRKGKGRRWEMGSPAANLAAACRMTPAPRTADGHRHPCAPAARNAEGRRVGAGPRHAQKVERVKDWVVHIIDYYLI